MLVFRSLLFNFAFYVNLVLFLVLGFWFMFTPRSWSMAALKAWARVTLWLMKWITGTTMEVRGRENIRRLAGCWRENTSLPGTRSPCFRCSAILPWC